MSSYEDPHVEAFPAGVAKRGELTESQKEQKAERKKGAYGANTRCLIALPLLPRLPLRARPWLRRRCVCARRRSISDPYSVFCLWFARSSVKQTTMRKMAVPWRGCAGVAATRRPSSVNTQLHFSFYSSNVGNSRPSALTYPEGALLL